MNPAYQRYRDLLNERAGEQRRRADTAEASLEEARKAHRNNPAGCDRFGPDLSCAMCVALGINQPAKDAQ